MSTLCTYDILKSLDPSDKCDFVKDNCESDIFNFYSLHYCTFNGNFFITIPTYSFILIILFFLLSDTSNNFLSVSLTKIVEVLKMSQNLAGVTLLALGNGASDVISSLVASSDKDGIEFSIGALIGGGLFITCLVFGLVVFYGDNLRVTPSMFNRDILLYLIALSFLCFVAYNGSISFIESLGFIGIYIVNVGLAFWQDCNNEKKNLLIEVNKIEQDIDNVFPKIDEGSDENMDLVKNEENRNKIFELDHKENSTNHDSIDDIDETISIGRQNSIIADEIVKEIKSDQLGKETNINSIQNTFGKFIDENIQALKVKLKRHYFTYKET